MRTRSLGAGLVIAVLVAGPLVATASTEDGPGPRPHVAIRGVYGGIPNQLFDGGRTLADQGINAVWVGSGGLTREGVALLKRQGAKVYAEFNSMHDAAYLKDHPDAAPVGTDG